MKSRVMIQVADRRLVPDEWEVPNVGPGEALMQVEVCGICGSDVELYKGEFAAAGILRYPLIPGHEPIGRIVEIGSEAAKRWRLKIGDRIALEPNLSCGRCELCLSGSYHDCQSLMPPGAPPAYGFTPTDVGHGFWGGYSEFMHLHERTIFHRVPDSLPLGIAALYQPLGAGVRWAVQVPELGLGDSILILGSGQRGLGSVVAAKAAGAGQIIVTGTARSVGKLELAKGLGADHVIKADQENVIERVNAITGGKGVDIVLDTVPITTAPIADAVEVCRVGGTIVLAGIKNKNQPIAVNTNRLIYKEITMKGVYAQNYGAYVEAFRLLLRLGPQLAGLHTHEYKLSDVGQAVLVMARESKSALDPICVTIHPGDSTMAASGAVRASDK
jgi:threonine dehydrogenase-like Zn-dependent dehydrogenase